MSAMAAFAPDILTHIGPLPITNTLLHTLIVDGVLIGTAWYLSKRISEKPRGLQTVVEPVIEGIHTLTASIATTKQATQAIFPFVMSFFLFILVANFTGLLPGVGTIGFFNEGAAEHAVVTKAHATSVETPAAIDHAEEEAPAEEHTPKPQKEHKAEESAHAASTFKPLLRGATSDLNVTLALAAVSVIATHVLSIRLTGFNDYISRWISLNPINLYVGLLEFVAEFTKIISLSFRLFGNIFAGEVALHTISALFAFLAPLPFLLLESIVAVVQSLVFAILTLVFMAVLTTPHHHAEAHEKDANRH